MTDLDMLDGLFTLLGSSYDDVLSFVKILDNDQRLNAQILLEHLTEALTETRVERGAV